jgi:hypothetical protein
MAVAIIIPTSSFYIFLACIFISLLFAADVMAFFYAWTRSVWSARFGTAVTLSAALIAALCLLGL